MWDFLLYVGYVAVCCTVTLMAPKRKRNKGGRAGADAGERASGGEVQAAETLGSRPDADAGGRPNGDEMQAAELPDFRAKALALMCQQTRDMLCKERRADPGDEVVRDDGHEWLDGAWAPPQRVRPCDRAGCSAKGPSIVITT